MGLSHLASALGGVCVHASPCSRVLLCCRLFSNHRLERRGACLVDLPRLTGSRVGCWHDCRTGCRASSASYTPSIRVNSRYENSPANHATQFRQSLFPPMRMIVLAAAILFAGMTSGCNCLTEDTSDCCHRGSESRIQFLSLYAASVALCRRGGWVVGVTRTDSPQAHCSG